MSHSLTHSALARALRDREAILHTAAILAEAGKYEQLSNILHPYVKENHVKIKQTNNIEIDLSKGFNRKNLVLIQRYLNHMPRQVSSQSSNRRASVVIPLCNVNGVASILFEKRSNKVRTHKQQVCFPGGMVDTEVDSTIIETSLREMEEELGIPAAKTEILGILRCNWNEVSSLTGIAVTPVVGYIGDLNDLTNLIPNPDEVEQLFTVPMDALVDSNNWIIKDFVTPVFTGGEHKIWGLTAYLLDRFVKLVNKTS